MLICKNRKKVNVNDIFKDEYDLINYIGKINDKINIKNDNIKKLICDLYNKMLTNDGVINFNRFSRWYPKQLGFKKKNVLQLEFWVERGWDELESTSIIRNIMIERSVKSVNTKRKLKNNIIFDGNFIKIKFKTVEFESKKYPLCNICNNKLDLKKINYNNTNSEYYYRILGCSNNSCKSYDMNKTDKYKAFLPKNISNKKIKELKEMYNNNNYLCVNYWVKKGYSVKEAKKQISNIQKNYSSRVKNNFICSKENLRNRGYSDDEISDICLTPSSVKFWVKKGYSIQEAKSIISKNQSKISKCRVTNPILPNSVQYWINKGYSLEDAKLAVSKRQTTFSKQICIDKYGEELGLKKFTDRQIKWQETLLKNNNFKIGYSKISQELFNELLNNFSIAEKNNIFFATHNKEFKLNKVDSGGIWLYDFTDLNNKKIIEYHGDNFHANPKKYLCDDKPNPFKKNVTAKEIWEKDDIKLSCAKINEFDVLVIWDSEYRWGNKQKVIDKCLEFLGKK